MSTSTRELFKVAQSVPVQLPWKLLVLTFVMDWEECMH